MSRFIHKAVRLAVRARDGDVCRYCGRTVDWVERTKSLGATFDHVDPNGGDMVDNLTIACRICNISKGKRSVSEWTAADAAPHLAIKTPPDVAALLRRLVYETGQSKQELTIAALRQTYGGST